MPTRKEAIETIMDSLQAMKRKLIDYSARSLGSAEAITPVQWEVLRLVLHLHSISIKDIAQNLNISSSAATQLVDGLVQRGHLIRTENPEDRRVVVIQLSVKSRQHIRSIQAQALKKFTTMFNALNDAELATYAKLSQKIIDNL